MSSPQSAGSINNRQILFDQMKLISSSGEIFRPQPIKDIPELSRENLLNMLK
jgi:hypothetical protein